MSSNKTPYKKLPGKAKLSFERFGKAFHLKIRDAGDLPNVMAIDEAHWVAMNAPLNTINADPAFLDMLDCDRDDRISIREVKIALEWLMAHLKNHQAIAEDNLALEIDNIDPGGPEGQRIFDVARRIVEEDLDSDSSSVSLIEVRELINNEEARGLDHAGIVLPEAAEKPQIRGFVNDILNTVGGVDHPQDGRGVDANHLEKFVSQSKDYLKWLSKSHIPEGDNITRIMPVGRKTAAGYRLFALLKEKIDQYFALCGVVAMDPEAARAFRESRRESDTIDFSNSQAVEAYLAKTPISWPQPQAELDFTGNINPYYRAALADFRETILDQMLNRNLKKLTHSEWEGIKSQFAAHESWANARPVTAVDALDSETLRHYLDDPQYQDQLRELIEESHKSAFTLDNLHLIEKLILYQGYMLSFLRSYASFPHLYDPERRALFEMGTLIMDGRHFTLSIKVPDRKYHAQYSVASNMYVIYLEILRKEGMKLYEVAVPVTSGNRGNLQVGKWGIFQDIYGQELHARIAQIVENPISLSEAILAPFIKLGNAITRKLEEVTSEAEAKLIAKGGSAVTGTGFPTATPPADQKPGEKSGSGGVLAGGGIAIAALGSSIAFITKTLSQMSYMEILGGLLAAVLAVIVPASIVAWIKLSRRDLSAILEGSGWGINARMRLTRHQAHTFSFTPDYPLIGAAWYKRWYWWLIIAAGAAAAYWLWQQYLTF